MESTKAKALLANSLCNHRSSKNNFRFQVSNHSDLKRTLLQLFPQSVVVPLLCGVDSLLRHGQVIKNGNGNTPARMVDPRVGHLAAASLDAPRHHERYGMCVMQ